MKLRPLLVAFSAACLMLSGCAKFPSTGTAGQTKRLLFRMTTAAPLRTGLDGGGLPYVYVVALRLSTDPNPVDQGPIPIVIPGGNGIVAGNATHFILWNPLASPQYTIYRFTSSTLEQWTPVGTPINYQPVQNGDSELFFELDMSQLVPAEEVDGIQSIQANFLTMNAIQTGGGGRIWDALGDSTNPAEVNRYFQFQPRTSFEYTNANQGNIEPTGDTTDPQLDIANWSIEVRLP